MTLSKFGDTSWRRAKSKIRSFRILPLTPDLWPALEDLFGKHGACNGCWCMYWRIGAKYHKRPRELNRKDFRKIVKEGPPPGLVAFDGERAIGWCQLTPRGDLAWLNSKRNFVPVDAMPVWSITCFYVRRAYRRQGVMTALITEALKVAKCAKAPALEVYPVDTTQSGSTRNIFTGTASAFSRLGFKVVARRDPTRPIMRYDLKRIPFSKRRLVHPGPLRSRT